MITPRTTRLLRAPDLRAAQRAILDAIPDGLAARQTAVLLPSRSAAAALRRTLERAHLPGGGTALVLPDLLTRRELYARLHVCAVGAPGLLNEFDREVLMRVAAEEAGRGGAEAPFRVRPGLLAAMLTFYDELRLRGRSIDSLDRHVREPLEAVEDTDRGAARLLKQTRFLAAAFAAFERLVAASGRMDEHALRAWLLASGEAGAFAHVVVAVADQAADPHGLWPADFDLLARLPGLGRIDLVATERVLASGWHERLHAALPELTEERCDGSAPPVLAAPHAAPDAEPAWHFTARDREEELAGAARHIKARARDPEPGAAAGSRSGIVFQRPLPYLYLARQVLGSSSLPYQASDALPLAAEPFAAALDLLLVAAAEDASRAAIVELLASPLWRFSDPAGAGAPVARHAIAALDRALCDAKYLGGWDRLTGMAAQPDAPAGGHGRHAATWRAAAPALGAAAALAPLMRDIRHAATASGQLDAILGFIRTHEVLPPPGAADAVRHVRARSAILGALSALAAAQREFDDRPRPIAELAAALRRWIEGQTFTPQTGGRGVQLLDAPAAAFADLDEACLVGLVESDWPERGSPSIFYPAALLRDLGWPAEGDRLAASRARFQDLLLLPSRRVRVSSFTLEEDAIVAPSPFLEEIAAAGLAVERRAVAAARIFTHEALSLAPLAAAAAAGEGAEWLAVRQARTPGTASRYRGAAGPRAPEAYAVSRVERYLECPFKYFAAHVLRLDEERDEESGLSPLERGQLLHGVFESFFAAWGARGHGAVTPETLEEAAALFGEIAESEIADLPDADRALERTYLLGSAAAPGLAERAFGFEIEHGVPVVERLLEHEFDGTFVFDTPDGPRETALRGKADRIDLLADGTLRIVDYKLGRAPRASRALQLPVYGACASQSLEGRHGRAWTVAQAGYVAFREKNAFVELGSRGPESLERALRDGQQRLVDAIARIDAGDFPPSPVETWTCTRCAFPHVCRKDYVGDE